jgi:ATP-dependent DNA helicase RecQ
MVARRPSTPGELLDVSGVGPAKLERYGEAFLEALAG